MEKKEWHETVMRKVTEKLEKYGDTVWRDHKGENYERLPLYFRTGQRRDNRLAWVDIVVMKDGKVEGIIEVQKTTRPKDIIGIIGAINMATIHSPTPKNKEERKEYTLKKIKLVVIVPDYKEKSSKKEQMEQIAENINLERGCIEKLKICQYKEFTKCLDELFK